MGQCSASLRTGTLSVMHKQVVGMAVCKFEHKALRELKRDETVQAWRQKTLRAIKLKISL
jgi:hypothetical protein